MQQKEKIQQPQASTGLVYVGAYALGSAKLDATWYNRLSREHVGGLEVPFTGEADRGSVEELFTIIPPHWDILLTVIPRTMQALNENPYYGLASLDDSGRAAAIADVRSACRIAGRLAHQSGRPRVMGIEVHSAPGPHKGAGRALESSLYDLLADVPAGTTLYLEHCDQFDNSRTFAKGFLPFSEELDVLKSVQATVPSAPLGVSINWGRSAIEGRSATTPIIHAQMAAATNVPVCAVLSGASDQEGLWGPSWSDTHIPPRGEDPALAASHSSLLGEAEIADFVQAAKPHLVAIKVSNRHDSSTETSLAVATATTRLVHTAMKGPK